MARVYSNVLNAEEYDTILQEIADTRGVKHRSAERALQRYFESPTPRGLYGSSALQDLVNKPREIDGKTFVAPNVSGKFYDTTEDTQPAYSATAWDVEAEVEQELEADAERYEQDVRDGRKAIRQKRETLVVISRIVSATVKKMKPGEEGQVYNAQSGNYVGSGRARRGQEYYTITYAIETTYIH